MIRADLHTAQAVQQDLLATTPVARHGVIRQWIGRTLGSPLVSVGSKLMADPVALRNASAELADRANNEDRYGLAA